MTTRYAKFMAEQPDRELCSREAEGNDSPEKKDNDDALHCSEKTCSHPIEVKACVERTTLQTSRTQQHL